jgi:hypothetical protein
MSVQKQGKDRQVKAHGQPSRSQSEAVPIANRSMFYLREMD